jgi:Bacterial Ig domain
MTRFSTFCYFSALFILQNSLLAAPPTVSWLSPDAGTTFSQGEIITLQVAIAEPAATIQLVEFLDDGVLIGRLSTGPYRWAWRGAALGTHQVSVRATNTLGEQTTTPQRALQVNAFVAGTNFITSWNFNGANASTGAQGWIDTNLDGNDWRWQATSGIDGTGGWFHSLIKTGNFVASPAVAMLAGVTYTISFAARQNRNDQVRKIRCAVGTSQNRNNITDIALIDLPADSYNTPPFVSYHPTFTPSVSGNYHLVFYLAEGSGYKDIFLDDVAVERTIFPTISILNPLNNSILNEDDALGTNISFNFSSQDSDGQVSRIELFQNGKLLLNLRKSFNDTTWIWNRVLPGEYQFVARATDEQGNSSWSDTVRTTLNFSDGQLTDYLHWNFTAANQSEAFAPWKFNYFSSQGDWRWRSNQGWLNTAHAEAFNVGPVSFMASQGVFLAAGQSYRLSFRANPQNRNTPLRFAYHTQPSLGGTTIREINLPNTSTPTNSSGRDNFQTFFTQDFTVPASGLYYLIVSHPSTNSGFKQIKFDELRLRGPQMNSAPLPKMTYPVPNTAPVNGTSVVVNVNAAENASLLLRGTATDADGSVTKMEFFDNEQIKLGESTMPTSSGEYQYRWENLPLGTHRVQLRAVDNESLGDSTVKAIISVQPSQFVAASLLGGAGNDDIRGMVIQKDGTIVLAANLANGFSTGILPPTFLANATLDSLGCLVRLSRDGRQVLSVTRLAARVVDLSSDSTGNLYVAAGRRGAFKIDPSASQVIWHQTFTQFVQRIDAGLGGFSALLLTGETDPDDETWSSNLGIRIYDPAGNLLGQSGGASQFSADVAIDEASQTVVSVGFRNFNAQTTAGRLPVYTPVVRGHAYNGSLKYKAYDWEADSLLADGATRNPRWINAPENNMADVRGYKCEIGQDGKLYILYEVYGGNHIFRYQPFSLAQTAPIVSGDMYFNFANTGTEVKLFIGKYEPSDFTYLLGQQLTNRINPPLNQGNTIFGRFSGLAADSTGRVYLTGSSASGMPITLDYQPGEYSGGAYIYVLSPDFRQREICTRLTNGRGRALAVRSPQHWAVAGSTSNPMYTVKPLQTLSGGQSEGFFVVKGAACGVLRSIKSGHWNDPSVWSCGRIPLPDDTVLVSSGHVVTLPTGFYARVAAIQIEGILEKSPESLLDLRP